MTTPAGVPARRGIPELLAPAGSPEAFRAAVAAGADAIYLSGKRFGARKFAANFSDEEIEEAVRLAHTHGVRVYITVNTLIHDRELSPVLEYLIWLYATGVDAVLVQDTGLATLAREKIPGLTLHASTQMTIHNAAGVRWAAELGFTRVVLARELSLDEVKTIAEETKDSGVGLEVFAHGALCYSYSGQCLLSSVIGGRSGNRGMCAQPCRKPWIPVSGTLDEYGRPGKVSDIPVRDRYLLSPKDLCTYRYLPELVRSPVQSLKIEGRMKSPEYVAIVVSTYRKALDAIAAGTWKPSDTAERDLLLAFNRGFTGGYLFRQRHERLMGREAPDNRGLPVGTVTRYDKVQNAAIIRITGTLIPEPGDGVLIAHPDFPEEVGFALNTRPVQKGSEISLRVPRPVRAGSAVFVTASRELDARARQILAKPVPELLRPVPVDLLAELTPHGTLAVSGSIERPDGTKVPVACRPEAALSPAESRPLTREAICRQLEKSGGTPFTVRSLALAYSGDHFIPVAEINRLRREFFTAAAEALVASYRPTEVDLQKARHLLLEEPDPSTLKGSGTVTLTDTGYLQVSIWVDTLAGVKEAAAAGIGSVCFEPDLCQPAAACGKEAGIGSPCTIMEEALGICNAERVRLSWKLPHITHDRYLKTVLPDLPALMARGLAGCMVDNAGTALAVRNASAQAEIAGSTGLNIFNHAAAIDAGRVFFRVSLSPELSQDEIVLLLRELRSRQETPSCALIVQGISETMITEDCLKRVFVPCAGTGPETKKGDRFTGIRDTDRAVFPVWTDGSCRTRIGNYRELSLIEYLPELRSAGIREVIIDARGRQAGYAGRMCRIYREAVALANEGSSKPLPASLKRDIEKIAFGAITTGHFLRGLRE
jgi:U32 family peptidase